MNTGTTYKNTVNAVLLLSFLVLSSFIALKLNQRKTMLFLVGDSTVKNGKGKGDGNMWGWGDYMATYFDAAKITVENDALGGTSSRTFQTHDLWDKVLVKIQPGDYVIMQFGHNDSGALDDTARARGTIKGVGDESKEIYNPIEKKQEVVHTYGWYLRKMVTEAKAKGAVVIICSPIPRNDWKDGLVIRNDQSYGKWSDETAETTGAFFIDLNKIIADTWEEGGQEKAKQYFPNEKEHTHTNKDGAIINAGSVISGLKGLPGCKLNDYLR